MPLRRAQRMDAIHPFYVMELMKKAAELEAAGREVIHLELGEPDFSAPAPVVAAAQQVLAKGDTFYTAATGLPALRERIARWYQERYEVSVSPERIVVTQGASGGLLMACAMHVNPGEQLMLPDPGYPCNRHFLSLVGGQANLVAVGEAERFQLTGEKVREHWNEQTAGILVASPANPTGLVLSGADLDSLYQATTANQGIMLVDEIYHGLTYGCEAPTALSVSSDITVINSFSKYFGMTGWRLGWLVVPEALWADYEKLAQNFYIAPPTVSQHAALAAFSEASLAELEARREAFHARRDFLVPALQELGFRIAVEPEGAFYIYADASRFTDDSYRFCLDALEATGVAFTPGIDFGEYRARQMVRFAYAMPLEKLEQAVEWLRPYLGRL